MSEVAAAATIESSRLEHVVARQRAGSGVGCRPPHLPLDDLLPFPLLSGVLEVLHAPHLVSCVSLRRGRVTSYTCRTSTRSCLATACPSALHLPSPITKRRPFHDPYSLTTTTMDADLIKLVNRLQDTFANLGTLPMHIRNAVITESCHVGGELDMPQLAVVRPILCSQCNEGSE